MYMPSLTKRRSPKVVKTLLLNSLFKNNWESISEALGFLLLLTIVGIIFVQEGARRIPMVSAKRQIGNSTLLPTRQKHI